MNEDQKRKEEETLVEKSVRMLKHVTSLWQKENLKTSTQAQILPQRHPSRITQPATLPYCTDQHLNVQRETKGT